jgi:hypothetical protein
MGAVRIRDVSDAKWFSSRNTHRQPTSQTALGKIPSFRNAVLVFVSGGHVFSKHNVKSHTCFIGYERNIVPTSIAIIGPSNGLRDVK